MIFTSLFYGLGCGTSSEKPPRRDKLLLGGFILAPSGNSFPCFTPQRVRG